MKFLLPMAIAYLEAVLAYPSQLHDRGYFPCPNNLYDTAYCCSEGPFGDYVDCTYPVIYPISASDFQDQCAWVGKIAVCCVRPLIGTPAVLCTNPPSLGPFGVK
ncbi:hypothetical protein F5Y08DRAFT_297357 [Xylaria arbuscula]|nr:hypothetical protein F5Y08DRAFT_297357 [Xylaria arbuscula]